MRAELTRTERAAPTGSRGAGIFGLLIAIFVVRFFVDTPGLSLVFLAIFPIVLAAFALGRDAALICGAVAAALSVIVPILSPGADVSTSAQVVGGVFRAVVFVGLAALVSGLIERAADLRRRLTDAEEDVRELESLRAALTSPELPAVDGLSIATSYTPADGPVAGDFFLVAPSSSDSVLVVVGDVVGHGLAAARRASFVRATIALFAEHTNDPMSILRLANTAIAEREPGNRVRHRAVRDLRGRSLDGDLGQRGPPAALGPRSGRAAGHAAPLHPARDPAGARRRGDDHERGARWRAAPLHRRPARGQDGEPRRRAPAVRRSRPRERRCARCAAPRRRRSSPRCAARRSITRRARRPTTCASWRSAAGPTARPGRRGRLSRRPRRR
jgi:Stage II sporulation protein E (SpoIIE)